MERLVYRPSTLVPLSCFAIYCLYLFVSYVISSKRDAELSRKQGCKQAARYPQVDPILGIDGLFRLMNAMRRGHLLDEFQKRFRTVSGGVNTYTTTDFGLTVIHTIEPENIKTVFATKFKDYGLPPQRVKWFSILGPSVFANDGHDWEVSRALVRPNFVRSQVADMPVLETHVRHLLDKLPRDGQVVDLQELFPLMTMDSSTEMLLGESIHSLTRDGDPRFARFTEFFEYVSLGLSKRVLFGKLATIIPDPKFMEGIRALRDFTESFVTRAMAEQESSSKGTQIPATSEHTNRERYVFLNEIIKTEFDKERIISELLSILLAGRDTTAGLLSLVFYTLVRHPGVLQKLREEIKQELGTTPPSFEQLKDLRYLNWVVKEVHRLYPIVSINARVSIADTILPLGGGKDEKSPILVRKGTVIFHYPFCMHRRKDLFGPDAEEFMPERWSTLRTTWEYLPFSGGPRVCIGQNMAMTETSYTVVRMLQTFKEITPGDDSVWAEKLTATLSAKDGCKVRLVPA